jgi:hypothetical protein
VEKFLGLPQVFTEDADKVTMRGEFNRVRKIRRSRKYRTCSDCNRPIRVGWSYVRVTGVYHDFGGFFTWNSCEECAYNNNFIQREKTLC